LQICTFAASCKYLHRQAAAFTGSKNFARLILVARSHVVPFKMRFGMEASDELKQKRAVGSGYFLPALQRHDMRVLDGKRGPRGSAGHIYDAGPGERCPMGQGLDESGQ
jgi:hypothetical protein